MNLNKNRFYVYCHRKKTNGECFYIGKGTGNRYKSMRDRNKHWYNIVNKYGFETEILINNISEEKAFELESLICKKIGYNNLCNINEEKGNGGYSKSLETKQKISKKLKNKLKSKEHIQNMKKPKPQDFGEKLSKQRKGNWIIPVHQKEACIKAHNKPTLQFTLNGEFVKEYESAKIAAKSINVHEVNMRLHLGGKYKTCKGFIFKYK